MEIANKIFITIIIIITTATTTTTTTTTTTVTVTVTITIIIITKCYLQVFTRLDGDGSHSLDSVLNLSSKRMQKSLNFPLLTNDMLEQHVSNISSTVNTMAGPGSWSNGTKYTHLITYR